MARQRAEPNRLVFGKARLTGLPLPAKGRVYYYDTKTPGLCLCVTAAGTKTFYLYRRTASRPVRVRLGRFPEMTIEQARRRAVALTDEILEAKDLQARKQSERQQITLGELFTYYLEHHAKPHKRTWGEDQRQFERYLAGWRNRRLGTVRKRDVQTLHTRIGAECGPYAANRLRSLLHKLFVVAKGGDLFDGPNPVQGVERFAESTRERFLDGGELRRFLAALAEEPNHTVSDYLLLSLLIGARRSNMLAMAWEDVSFDLALWRIPDAKSSEPLTVPLSPEAVTVLQERWDDANGSPWVFPAAKSKSGHLQDPTKVWKRVLKRAELTDLRIHDLRRTLGSWQAVTGSSLPTIGRSLGHKRAETTEIYARLNLDPVRQSVEQATTAMLAVGGVLPEPDDLEQGGTA